MSYTCTYNDPYFDKFSYFKILLEHGSGGGPGVGGGYTPCDIMT